MSSQSITSSEISGGTGPTHQPYILYAISSRPPGSVGSSSGGAGGAHGRDPIQLLCPYTGSNVTGAHPLRVPASSTAGRGGTFGVRCLIPVPLTNMMGGGGDDANATVFVGHGGGGGETKSQGGGKDDHAFLLSRLSGGVAVSVGGNNPRWKVRLPEALSPTHQSMAVSPDGRFLAAGSVNGTCFLWEWTSGEDNLVKVWKAHYRPVTCLAFDKDDGATLFTAGEDGVVNAWCLLDLVDQDSSSSGTPSMGAVHPYRTWSEHHLPVTSVCVLSGSGCGSTRLVSSSLDRNLIIMELGGSRSSSKSLDGSSGARTLARICLPSGLHSVISDSSSGRLFGAGSDGNIYCVDLDGHAIHETLDGAGTFVNANQCNDLFLSSKRGKSDAKGNFESLLSGSHVAPSSSSSSALGLSTDQNKYVSELKGHVKAVVSLALLDPADLASSSNSGKATPLLASGSEDGTVRIWDLHSRSCVKVLRPWSPSSEGVNISSASSAASFPPITAIVAVPKSSLTSGGGALAMSSAGHSMTTPLFRFNSGRRAGANTDYATLFKPLKRFLRGTSVVSQSHLDHNADIFEECAPMLWPRRGETFVRIWEESVAGDVYLQPNKKARKFGDNFPSIEKVDSEDSSSEDEEDDNILDDKAEIARLRKALEESETIIERWQTVNNQLVSKLKKQSTSKKR